MNLSVSKPLPHPRALAHLGDAVYELWVREAALAHSDKSEDLHLYTTRRVNMETQEKVLGRLIHALPEDIHLLVKRAQNMPVTTSRRSNQASYRKATAFEALIGYWYLMEHDKLSDYKTQVLALVEEVLAANPLL